MLAQQNLKVIEIYNLLYFVFVLLIFLYTEEHQFMIFCKVSLYSKHGGQ